MILGTKPNIILSKLIALFIFAISGHFNASGQAPVSNFTGSPLSGCSPLIVIFQDLSTGSPTLWSWSFGNGNTSTIQNPTATYFTPGTYTVILTTTNASGTNTLTRTSYITVYDNPTVNFSSNVTSGCFPLRVQFTDGSTPGIGNTNVSWEWDFGNGTTSTLQNPLATYNTAGTFNVTLKVTNDKGCIRTLSRPNYIAVTTGVVASFTNPQPTVCAAPASISFTNTSTGPPTLSYQWDFGDGSPISTVMNPVHIYNASGTFTATLITTSSAGCEDTARSVPIIVGGYNPSFTSPATVCINLAASFVNTSSPLPINSTWNFGDGSPIGTGLNVTHTYTVAGPYTVWMYNNNGGCVDSVSQLITVAPDPVADFTAPFTSRCEPPLTVNFQDLSTGGAVGWQWDFGDGNTSTAQNPTHTYIAYGNFTVTLIATNASGCNDTITRTSYIRVQRAAITIPNLPARGCIPFTISPTPIITSVDAITSYEWDFGDGSPASFLPNPTHTYLLQGTYTVRLIITTSTGCRDTLLIPAAVRTGSIPIADFSAIPLPNVCATESVQFTDLSTPATVDEWQWDFGDGATAFVRNPLHNYNDTGYFTIRLIAMNNGCPDTVTKIDYMYVLPPIARFTYTPNCGNRVNFTFTDNSIINPMILPVSWQWDFGDATSSTLQNPVHNFPGLGIYTVRLIVNNGGCADTTYQTINAVDETPDFTADQTTTCKIATIIFNAANLNFANITSYTWDFGDATPPVSVVTPAVSHIYNNAGTYTVRLITTDLNGCSDTITKANYIRINGPIAGFTATNTGGCAGNLITTFNNTSTPDGVNAITNWQWDFGDGIIQNFTAPPFIHTYNATGVFSVKLVITDAAGCRDSITVNNFINATDPVPDFISVDTLTCPAATVSFTNTSTPAGVTNTWYFGDGGTSLLTSPTYNYAVTGIYDVKLVIQDAFGCMDSITKTAYIRVDEPIASFTVSDSISSCTPLEVQFTNTSTYYTSVVWDFGPAEGNSTLNNPIHFYSVPGTYIVKLLITSPGGCLDSAFHTITVYDTIGSNVNYLPLGGCKPLDVTLNILTPGPMVSYYWDFGDGFTQTTTAATINHTYASYGNFLPKIIMEDPSGCLIPLQGIDTVYVTGAEANFGNHDSLLCDFGIVNFTDSTTFNDPVSSYNWNFGDGGTSVLSNPSHLYTAPGIYTVRLIVQTQLGCLDTLIKPNIVKVIQRPLIDISGDSVLCINSSLLHFGIFLIPDTSVVTWSWNFPNGNTSINQNPVVQTYKQAGNFTVTAIATNSSGCKDTTTQSLLVNPLPTVVMPNTITIQAGFPATIPATYATNVNTWLWSPATGLSCTNCSNPIAGPNFNTFYQVAFTDANGCTNFGSILVQVLCQNSNLFIPNTFSPNGDGSNDKFYPRGVGLDRVKVMRIFNRWGEVVFEKRDFPINDAAAGWDGTYKGKAAQADVYIYQAEVFCQNGEIIKLNGNIALIL